eukprot:TRINITY_DN8407_c0_g1_i5.p1 TRINITY_DN8407_c0_g1~~TRINITY_DN8407_c0_g1_i5.p1  ORF type:complete len:459 (+),score=82.20 TRINITY_DN8407_c0_g1_i5:196-1572(+)
MHKKSASVISLKLAPSSLLPCHCQVCAYYSPSTCSRKNLPQRALALAVTNGDLGWLLLLLCSLKRPLAFMTPDAVFWKDGNPTFIVRMKDDGRLARIGKDGVSKGFARCFLSDSQRSFSLRRVQEAFANANKYKKEQAELLRKNNYKAVLRYAGEACLTELLTDKAIREIFTLWTSSKLKKIASIHSCILPLGSSPQIIRIHYPFEQTQKEQRKNPRIEKCTAIIKELIDSIGVSTNIRVHKLSVEFFTTDEEIWLNNAWNIKYITVNIERVTASEKEAAKAISIKLQKTSMLSRLSKYKHEINANKVEHIEVLADCMASIVKKIKSSASLPKLTHQPSKKSHTNLTPTYKYASTPASPNASGSKRSLHVAKDDLTALIWRPKNMAERRKHNDMKAVINTMVSTISAKSSPCNRSKRSTGTVAQTDKANSRWSSIESSRKVIKISRKYGEQLKLAMGQ